MQRNDMRVMEFKLCDRVFRGGFLIVLQLATQIGKGSRLIGLINLTLRHRWCLPVILA